MLPRRPKQQQHIANVPEGLPQDVFNGRYNHYGHALLTPSAIEQVANGREKRKRSTVRLAAYLLHKLKCM
jgi:hypothetical protein